MQVLVLTALDMVLVSHTRSHADKIVTLDNVNKFINPSWRVSIDNLSMFSKKYILEASVYLLGDKEIDEEEFLAIYEIAIKRRQHPYKLKVKILLLQEVTFQLTKTGVISPPLIHVRSFFNHYFNVTQCKIFEIQMSPIKSEEPFRA